jgi:hypothetical protein
VHVLTPDVIGSAAAPERRQGDSELPDLYPAKRAVLADSHRARSKRSSRARPGSNGQPPSPTAGWVSPLPGRRALGGFRSRVDHESRFEFGGFERPRAVSHSAGNVGRFAPSRLTHPLKIRSAKLGDQPRQFVSAHSMSPGEGDEPLCLIDNEASLDPVSGDMDASTSPEFEDTLIS